jgi:transposase
MTCFGWKKRCRQLEAEKACLQERNAQLEARVQELAAKNTQLVQALAAAKKHSGNSSKPPSSDIVKPPPKKLRPGQRRKIGGQPGHPKHEHPAFTAAQIDHRILPELARCPVDASHRLLPVAGQQKTLQQVELVVQPFVVTEHVAQGYWCEGCHQYHYAAFPPAVLAGGLCGPRLTSLVSYFKGKLHGSYSGIQDFFTDVLGLQVSRGYLAKLLQKAARAFAEPCSELMGLLPQQPCLNIDETGHKENGARYWTWCFRAKAFIVFKIDPSRGSDVLRDVLGQNFAGILGADFWGAYRKYARQGNVLIQFCLAHLVREVKYLCEFPEPSVQSYGQGLLAGLKELFATLHRRAELSQKALALALALAEAKVWDAALDPMLHPRRYPHGRVHRLIENLTDRFYHHGEGYFRFITSPEIQPTNNSAEQAMRFVVMDRHMTQGTRSQRGRDFCERIWTVMATCALQKRSAYHWMHQAIGAYFNGRPVPSLLLDSS